MNIKALPAGIRQRPSQALAALLCLSLCWSGCAEGLYHSMGETLHWFVHAAKMQPTKLRYEEIALQGHPHKPPILPLATLTAFDKPGADTRPVAVLVFGEHAREVITTELGLWLSRVLLGEANASVLAWPQTAAAFKEAGLLDLTLPGSSGAAGRRAAARRSLRDPGSAVEGGGSSQEEEEGVSAAGSESASEGLGSSLGGGAGWRSRKLQEASVVEAAAFWSKYILERLALQVLPIENMDGRALLEQGELCRRKTASNVDLNRNYPFAWKGHEPGSEMFGGAAPFSEPQSKVLRDRALKWKPRAFVNVHSGEWAVYNPWDSRASTAAGLPLDLGDLVAAMGRLCNCIAGPAGAVSNYLAFGTSMDWFFTELGTPYPLTIELYGSGNAGKLAGSTNRPIGQWPITAKEQGPGHARHTTAASASGHASSVQGHHQHHSRHMAQAAGGAAATTAAAASAAAVEVEGGLIGQGRSRRHLMVEDLDQAAEAAVTEDTGLGGAVRVLHQAGAASATAAGQQQGDALMQLVKRSPAQMAACFEMFNPMQEAEYREVIGRWVAIMLHTLRHIANPSHPGKQVYTPGPASAGRQLQEVQTGARGGPFMGRDGAVGAELEQELAWLRQQEQQQQEARQR